MEVIMVTVMATVTDINMGMATDMGITKIKALKEKRGKIKLNNWRTFI